jgi:transcription-repair coupling factor (superfamily II helicase)
MPRTYPDPSEVVGRLLAAPSLRAAARAAGEKRALAVSGMWGSSLAAVTAGLEQQHHRPVLVICGHVDEADDLADDLELFHGRRPDVLVPVELSGSLGKVSEEQVANRLQLIARLQRELEAPPKEGPRLLVAPVQAIMQSVPSREQLASMQLALKPGMTLPPEKLIRWLVDHGYNRLDQVEVPGDFAVHGGIVDLYLPGDFEQAVGEVGLTARVDFFGDEIESIRRFSLDTLGSQSPLDALTISDIKGQVKDVSESTILFNYLPRGTILVFWAPLEIAEQSKSYLDRLPEASGVYPLQAILRHASAFTCVELSQFDQGAALPSLMGESAAAIRLPVQSLQRFETESVKALQELADLAAAHNVTVFCENLGEATRFAELLEQHQPQVARKIEITLGYLHRGFVWREGDAASDAATQQRSDDGATTNHHPLTTNPPAADDGLRATNSLSMALVGHHEIFHRYEMRRRVKKVIESRPVDSFVDLKVGDYVVHVAHGIARFMGMQTIAKDGRTEEFLSLRFADNATLHVPAARINLVQKYVGGFHGHPQLSKLGSGAWEKQKEKVAEAVMDMAAELLEIQAAREAELGLAYPPDTAWQQEFEAEFPYTPTTDQLTSAEEIKKDMQKKRPMDRLLCGDVGYGKTEMAMRAAFKAVEYGKQVAVLVPTTVLAEQHFRSFRERFANYPFIIESLSRFKSAREQKATTSAASQGKVDILIGTHRILSQDVKFADLGLVIIDEEQRFGVVHKERLKQFRKTVDVLTMSATPIPRTLHFSLLGLRDISSLTTAPQDRRSIVTEIIPFDKQRVKQAILRELNRDGQVYFVHNRVYNIQSIADELHQLVPDARVIIGHGQMAEGELEKVMLQFVRHEADILVCTTIIESGLDIPNVNTIFVNQADRFGLSELHQLRGRVGRYKHRAYCYLLLPPDRPVSPVAAKRLKAIEEYSHLGAGFKIAMRDLEIRGAGNILGPEQSGHIAAVGYEMYCQLLEDATHQIKHNEKPHRPDAHVDIGVTAFIPKPYISADLQRLDIYRRLTRCGELATLDELRKDVGDAFGPPPRQVELLFALTELRLLAGHFGIESVIRQPPDVVMKVTDAALAQNGLSGAPGSLRVIDEKTVYFRPPTSYLEPDTLLMVLRNLVRKAYDRGSATPPPAAVTATPSGPAAAAEAPRPAAPPAGKSPAATATKLPQKSAAPSRPAPPPRQFAAPAKSAVSETQQHSADAARAALETLRNLRKQGILSEAEFQAACQRIRDGHH